MDGKLMPTKELAVQEWVWNKDEDPAFHRKTYSKALVKFSSRLLLGGKAQRVFVPLCGKSLDMIYLADLGQEVVGLEYSDVALYSFLEENGLTCTKEKLENTSFTLYKVNEKNITIYNGDFFQLRKEICGQFDAFWDRGSFVAINVAQRMQYTDIVFALMKPTSRYLLEAMTYDGARFAGPPHYVTDKALEETFGRKCSIEMVDKEKRVATTNPPNAPSDFEMWYLGYLITSK